MSQMAERSTAPTTLRTSNPAAPDQAVFEYTATDQAGARDALARADAAAPSWAQRTAGQRAAILSKAADELAANASQIARMITLEEGKPLSASTGEVAKTVEQFRFGAQLAYQVEGTTYPSESADMFTYTLRSPLGVIVAITPWNFPISLAARKIAPALAAGNAVVFKPSPVTAGTGDALVRACYAAGIPQDVLVLIQGDDPDAMSALVSSPIVDAVTFTGSDRVGDLLRRTTNPRARLQFELGGHNAAVVCADADLPSAVAKVAGGAFGLTGQACTATDRVLVQREVYDAFLEQLEEQVLGYTVGPGEVAATTVGPVSTRAQYDRLSALQSSAAQAGSVVAQTVLDPALDDAGYWVAPTVFADLPADHPMNTGEIFGPLLSVIAVDSVSEAIELVNASAHGLVTAIHTSNLSTAHDFARRAACGLVKVNDRTTGNAVAPPFGGWKASSSGSFPEGGRSALDFVTDTKSVYVSYQEV